MNHFDRVREALIHIDAHLDEEMDLRSIAERFHFSPFFFHRVFTSAVGETLAAFVRDRRLLRACQELALTERTVLSVGLDCGFRSAPAFSRAFRERYGVSPSEYRRQGYAPVVVTVDELLKKFTNRLKGGVFVDPNIIRREELLIAGVRGDGARTGEAWEAFMALQREKPLGNALGDNGYEIRLYAGDRCDVHVGLAVRDEGVDPAYALFRLPASAYASFDVYVEDGYDSENDAMDRWLRTNEKGYEERLLGEAHYCVEYYDERFRGDESGSIVEIWVPVRKRRASPTATAGTPV